MRGALRVQKVEELVLYKPTAEVPSILPATEVQLWELSCRWRNLRRGVIRAPIKEELAVNIIGTGFCKYVDGAG